jgi:hypothetical protein
VSIDRAKLAELRRLEEAATKGPWESCHDGHSPENGKIGNWVNTTSYATLPDPENSIPLICDCPNDSANPLENAALIAAARNNLPALLAAADELLMLKWELAGFRAWLERAFNDEFDDHHLTRDESAMVGRVIQRFDAIMAKLEEE